MEVIPHAGIVNTFLRKVHEFGGDPLGAGRPEFYQPVSSIGEHRCRFAAGKSVCRAVHDHHEDKARRVHLQAAFIGGFRRRDTHSREI